MTRDRPAASPGGPGPTTDAHRTNRRVALAAAVLAVLMTVGGGAVAGPRGLVAGLAGAVVTGVATVLVLVQRNSIERARADGPPEGPRPPRPVGRGVGPASAAAGPGQHRAPVPRHAAPDPAPAEHPPVPVSVPVEPSAPTAHGPLPGPAPAAYEPQPGPVPVPAAAPVPAPAPVPAMPAPAPVRLPVPGPGPGSRRAPAPVREFPLLAAPSQVASAPWRLPGRPSPTGVAADRAEVGDLTVAAASVVGPGHRCETAGLPRQDAYRLGQDTARDHLIVAVADGMSDSEHADVGAAVAVAAAVGRLRTALDQGTGLDGLDARELFRVAAGQLLGAAEQRGWSPDDVRTVMAVAVVETRPGPAGGRRAWLASVADTGVWLRRGRGWTRLTGDAKSGMDGGRLSEFLPHLPDAVRQESYLLAGDDVLAVVTDGLSDLWDQVPSAQEWFADAWAQPCGVVDLVRHVGYEAGQFNDDRTAVVVWCDGSGGGVR